MMRRFLSAAGLLTALILCGAQPAAAKPTEAQLDAIKANCRSDFMSNCWGVPRGGAEAFQCLKEHMASLSSGCQTAIKAAMPAPAPAKTPAAPAKEAAPAPAAAEPAPAPAASEPAAPPAPQQEAAPAQEAVPAKEPETKSASPAAQESTTAPAPKAAAAPPPKTPAPESAPPAKAAKTEAPAAPEASSNAPSAATEDAPAIIGFIPPRKKLMVQRHCRQELETYCADIDVGQGRVLRCLFSHKSALTPDCQGALAKLGN